MKRIITTVIMVFGMCVLQAQDEPWIPKDIYKTPDSLMTDSDYIRIPNWGDIVMIMVEDSIMLRGTDTSTTILELAKNINEKLRKKVDNLDLWVSFNFPDRYEGIRFTERNIERIEHRFTPTGYLVFKVWENKKLLSNVISKESNNNLNDWEIKR